MSELARQQRALLDALFDWPPQNAMKLIAACAIDTALAAINPDNLSPREALDALYQLKKLSAAKPG